MDELYRFLVVLAPAVSVLTPAILGFIMWRQNLKLAAAVELGKTTKDLVNGMTREKERAQAEANKAEGKVEGISQERANPMVPANGKKP